MSDDGFFGEMPYLATMPSCVLYVRQTGTPSGGTTFKDWSSTNATITAVGSPVNSISSAKFPPASIYFNGSSYLSVAYNSRFNLGSNNFFISHWLNPTSDPGNVTFYFNPQGINYCAVQLAIGSGTQVQVYVSTNGSSWANTTYSFSATMTTGAWNNLSLARVGTTFTLYCNGASVGTFSVSGTLYNGSSPSAIACQLDPSPTAYTTGYIDEIAVWNGAYGIVPSMSDIWKGTTGITSIAAGQQRRLIVG